MSEWWDSVLRKEWYAVVNDLIGGWDVSTHDGPASDEEGYEIASFTNSEAAKHIARLHNEWLTR